MSNVAVVSEDSSTSRETRCERVETGAVAFHWMMARSRSLLVHGAETGRCRWCGRVCPAAVTARPRRGRISRSRSVGACLGRARCGVALRRAIPRGRRGLRKFGSKEPEGDGTATVIWHRAERRRGRVASLEQGKSCGGAVPKHRGGWSVVDADVALCELSVGVASAGREHQHSRDVPTMGQSAAVGLRCCRASRAARRASVETKRLGDARGGGVGMTVGRSRALRGTRLPGVGMSYCEAEEVAIDSVGRGELSRGEARGRGRDRPVASGAMSRCWRRAGSRRAQGGRAAKQGLIRTEARRGRDRLVAGGAMSRPTRYCAG